MTLTRALAALPAGGPATAKGGDFGSAGSRRFTTGAVVSCTSFHQRDMDVSGLGFAPGTTPFEEIPAVLEFPMHFAELPRASCGTGDSFETGRQELSCDVVDMEAYALARCVMWRARHSPARSTSAMAQTMLQPQTGRPTCIVRRNTSLRCIASCIRRAVPAQHESARQRTDPQARARAASRGWLLSRNFRSAARVMAAQRPERSALTTHLLPARRVSFSAWHRVRSDEVWHWYEGEPLELVLASPDFTTTRSQVLGPVATGVEPVLTVPADWWQAARPRGAYALCGCTVAPGFEFEDFTFLRDDAAGRSALQLAAPGLTALL